MTPPSDRIFDSETFRLHIKNNRSGEEVFRITHERFQKALERHRDLSPRIEYSIDWDLDNFDDYIAGAHGLITWDLPQEGLAERAPNLRWIHIIGAGIEHLKPLDWLPSHIALTNSKGVHKKKAQEYVAMALLMLNARLPALFTQQRAHSFESVFTGRIAGKTLLVVGAGHMGEAAAKAGKSLELKTLGTRKSGTLREGFDEMFQPDQLDRLLGEADFIVLTPPLTEETKGLMSNERLAHCKMGAGLINMSRGPVLDHEALAMALDSGRLSGAVIDVTDPEPLPAGSPLWDQANLIITPHVSSDDEEEYIPLVLDLVLANVARDLAGQALINRVDPRLGY
ncbi:MAG: D-2-hydroxyacid dehydrogenase [Kiloniellales bacterium]|nr:D-2-hydroxyacid dehydrogenase [Kiloniellales bacterium]